MAQATPSTSHMTPDEALHTIASVRSYREGLTARAAGIVWMVWGLALTLAMHAGLFTDYLTAGLSAPMQVLSMVVGSLGILLAVTMGAMLSNLVWHAHALEHEPGHRTWVPYAAAIGLVVAYIVVAQSIGIVGDALGWHGYYSPAHLLTAGGAFVIAYLQRHHVSPFLGYFAAALLVFVAIATFIPSGDSEAVRQMQGRVMVLLPLVAYGAVGLFTYRRG